MLKVGFVGTGAVGTSMARAFFHASIPVVALSSRTPERASRLAAEIGECSVYEKPQSVVDRADLVFLTVPDDAIEGVCDDLRWSAETTVVHCSGVRTLDVLGSASTSGAGVGSCHPMQTFTGQEGNADHLAGCMFGIEGEDPVRTTLADLVTQIGGWSLFLEGNDKVTYHLAGVFASNYLVSLSAVAASLMEELGADPDQALRGMLPIVRGTVTNIDEKGLPAALTGPIARGDTGTVELHLRELATRHPGLVPIYVDLGRLTLPLARARGGLSNEKAEMLERLFEQYQSG